MTQEEKQLLLKDLCARLPYDVKGIITYNGDKDIFTIIGISNILFLSNTECCYIEDFKPYLRSLSNMTKEEEIDYQAFFNYDGVEYPEEYIDWLNAHHFDYRGLISIGIALEAPNDMY